eukprot:TRINITY_DN5795_c0_g1_i3.p1 TRINITY_DN5795_c0_g1~~TRINITY_DN5795_c0_g1_i3.p1  ORF type:complete len:593 (+),score=164.60 TRINITY_DN5795_c0_g1_i3:71-1780(+)
MYGEPDAGGGAAVSAAVASSAAAVKAAAGAPGGGGAASADDGRLAVGARVRVLPGRQFEAFGPGDVGVVIALDELEATCDVLFDGRPSPLPVALRNLSLVEASEGGPAARACGGSASSLAGFDTATVIGAAVPGLASRPRAQAQQRLAALETAHREEVADLQRALHDAFALVRRQEQLLQRQEASAREADRHLTEAERRAAAVGSDVTRLGDLVAAQERRVERLQSQVAAAGSCDMSLGSQGQACSVGTGGTEKLWHAVRELDRRLAAEAEARAAMQRDLLGVLSQGVQQLRLEQATLAEELRAPQGGGEASLPPQRRPQQPTGRGGADLDEALLSPRDLSRPTAADFRGAAASASSAAGTPRATDGQSPRSPWLGWGEAGTEELAAEACASSVRSRVSRAGALGQIRGQLESLCAELGASAPLGASSSSIGIAAPVLHAVPSASRLPHASALQQLTLSRQMPPVVRFATPTAAHSSESAVVDVGSLLEHRRAELAGVAVRAPSAHGGTSPRVVAHAGAATPVGWPHQASHISPTLASAAAPAPMDHAGLRHMAYLDGVHHRGEPKLLK